MHLHPDQTVPWATQQT